jgi:hypothetical protein
MFDGLGENKDLWRGRAAFLAGPAPNLTKVDDKQLETEAQREIVKRPGSAYKRMQRHYLRYEIYLPIVPGALLASSVAAKRPEFASLISKSLPYWENLVLLGAKSRHFLASDEEVLSSKMLEMGREFRVLVDANFKQEAESVSKLMDAAEDILADITNYPSLEDCVIESAKRTIAFVENASPDIDFLRAGDIFVTLYKGDCGSEFFALAATNLPAPPVHDFSFHPFLGPKFNESVRSLFGSGIDPETGEDTLTATGGRELGLLLSDLCADKPVTVCVKAVAGQADVIGKLELKSILALRLRRTTTRLLELPQGLSPQDALAEYYLASCNYDFPETATIFAVTASPDYLYIQDFIVEGGSVLFSYAPGWSRGPDASSRLDDRVLRISSPLVAMQDGSVEGRLVNDRSVAAKLARRARWHASSEWAAEAPAHRIRVAFNASGIAVITGVHICGFESNFGIPYDRVMSALRAKRDRAIRHLHSPDTLRQIQGFRSIGGEPFPSDLKHFETMARKVLSRRIGTNRLSGKFLFLSEIESEFRAFFSRVRRLQDSKPLSEPVFSMQPEN